MDELRAWLNGQTGGMGTFVDFQLKALRLASQEEDQAALYQLLAAMAGRFATTYDGEPLPTAVAASALAQLRALLDRAAETRPRPAADQLRFLNEVARADLTQPA